MNGHLEEQLVTIGQDEPMIPCTRTPPGEAVEIFVRGGSWLWGSDEPGAEAHEPMVIPCEAPGSVHELSFKCFEKGSSEADSADEDDLEAEGEDESPPLTPER